MSFSRSPAVAVWLLAGAGAYSIGAAWADDAQAGKLHPWVLVAVFWGVALLSVSIHYLLQYLAQAAVWARRWHQQAEQRARLRTRVRIAMAVGAGGLRRSARQLVLRGELLTAASSVAAQAWDATRRAWEQQIAGARRAPGALIGWSRSALKALRA
jgi:Na+/proline symporter